MATAVGSVTVATDLDNSKLEKQYQALVRKITKLEEEIGKKRDAQSPLLEEAKQLGVEYDNARHKLAEMQSGDRFFAKSSIEEQAALVKQLELDWDKVRQQADKYGTEIQSATRELDTQKEKAGEIVQQLNEASAGGIRMGEAIDRAGAYMDKFISRIKRLAARALVFTVIMRAFRALRDWMGKVIRTNDEAATALAQLRGALLTLAQPLVQIIIPAFTVLVQVLVRVVSALAQLFAMLSGGTIDSSKKAAAALHEQTEALDGAGAAAEDAGKSMAGFDEINQLSDTSGGGGEASSVAAPAFDFEASATTEQLENIFGLIKAIGVGLLAWKLSSSLGGGLQMFLGLALAIGGATTLIKGAIDAWTTGVDWENFLQMLGGAAAVVAGLFVAFGMVAAAIGLVVAGLVMLVTAFHDAATNGWNLQNTMMGVAGILMTGLGIALLVGSWIPLLIAGIVALILVITTAFGHGEELIDGAKSILAGFIDFFVGIFTGDFERAIGGIGKIFGGLKTMIGAILDSVRDMFFAFLDWVDEKTGGRIHGLIVLLKGLIGGLTDWIKETIHDVLDAIQQIFEGIILFFAGVFTGDWEKAWEGIVLIVKGAVNLLISAVEAFVNFFVKAVNAIIGAINTISVDVPDWVPGIGGKKMGFNLPKVPELQIPRLATGAVIPPNREFLAVLGDQKSGRNLEMPEGLLRQIVREESGEGGPAEIHLHFDGELAALARIFRPYLDAEGARRGVKLITGGI